MVMSYFQRKGMNCRIESFYTLRTQKNIDCFKAVGFCGHSNTVFQARGCFYLYCPCQKARPALTEEEVQRGIKRRKRNEMRKQYIEDKGYTVVEMRG